MAEPRQAVELAIDTQNLDGLAVLSDRTKRSEITKSGALGIANNTGVVTIMLNGAAAARLWLHEDNLGYVVLDLLDHRNIHQARLDVEMFGFVPPRRAAPARKQGS